MLTETQTLADSAALKEQYNEVIRLQYETITRLEGEAKVLRDLLGEASDYIESNEVEPVDFQLEQTLLDKIEKAIRGTV